MAICGTGGWTGPLPGDPDNNLAIRAVPAFGGIDVSWTFPTTNPSAVAQVLLYRGITPVFDQASPLAVVAGDFYYDRVETGTVYYYWICVRSTNGTLGDPIGPASAMARPLIADLIAALTGYIDAGVLATTLRGQIDSISLNHAELLQEIQDRIANDGALTQALADMQVGLNQAIAFINSEISSRVDGDAALIGQVQTVAAVNQQNAAALVAEVNARVTADEAQTQQITQLFAANSTNTAAVQNLSNAMVTADSALAEQITNVETTLNGNIAAVETSMSTEIAEVNGVVTEIGALWTAKVNVNGLIGGFGVYNNGQEVQAGFDVDLFWVGRTNANKRKPFIILNNEVFIDQAAINSLVFNKLRDEAGSVVVENGKIKTNYIETKGLMIRDLAGNIILGSGVGLDWSNVAGAGKPQNNATYGATFGVNVSGQINVGNASTYIANAAIGTAQIANAAITSAKIGAAQIGTAHIGYAAVDTLILAGNAVTVPVAASAGGMSCAAGIYMPQDATVVVLCVCSGMYMKNGGLTMRVYCDGEEFHSSFSNSEGGVNPTLAIPLVATRFVGAGYHTFSVSIDANTGQNAMTSIVLLGAMR